MKRDCVVNKLPVQDKEVIISSKEKEFTVIEENYSLIKNNINN